MVDSEKLTKVRQEVKSSVREMGQSLLEITSAVGHLTRSEVRLAKEELKQELGAFKKPILFFSVAAIFSVLALLPLISFCVIGLGDLLNHKYWASSLIVFAVLVMIATVLVSVALVELNRARNQLKMTMTREAFQKEAKTVQLKLVKISDSSKRRMA